MIKRIIYKNIIFQLFWNFRAVRIRVHVNRNLIRFAPINLYEYRAYMKCRHDHLGIETWHCFGAHTLSISCTKSVISCKASILFSHARLQGSIFSSYCDSIWHKLSQYGKKILYTYVYHIVYYLRKCEALHEITDVEYQMLSVCAP